MTFLQRLLNTTRIGLSQWLICLGTAAVLIVVEEAWKLFARRSTREQTQAAPSRPAYV